MSCPGQDAHLLAIFACLPLRNRRCETRIQGAQRFAHPFAGIGCTLDKHHGKRSLVVAIHCCLDVFEAEFAPPSLDPSHQLSLRAYILAFKLLAPICIHTLSHATAPCRRTMSAATHDKAQPGPSEQTSGQDADQDEYRSIILPSKKAETQRDVSKHAKLTRSYMADMVYFEEKASCG